MRSRAKLTVLLCYLVVGGSLAAHLAYALHLHSDAHRKKVERALSEYFELPCSLRAIVPQTFSNRAFDGIKLWLPDRRDLVVFECDRAIWQEHSNGSGYSVDLDLLHGTLALGADAWRLEDYRRVLESGLRHDFADLRHVRMENFNITFRRKDLLLTVHDAGGTITFETPDVGIVSLEAYALNGRRVTQPIRIHARFLPKRTAIIDEMVLEIPEVALSGMALDAALGGPVTRGSFSGRLMYREHNPQPRLALSGRLYDVDLAELTTRLPTGPLHGTAEVTLDRAELVGTLPTRVLGRARLADVPLCDLAPLIGQKTLAGTAELNISDAAIEDGHIVRLVINGRAEGLELIDLLRPLGRGEATGRLTVVVNALRIEKDRIVSADIDIAAAPRPGSVGTIDRDLLLSAAQDLGGFSLPSAVPKRILPEQIQYTQFGMRLLVTDNRLRVLGTHGSDNETILTIRVLGTELGILKQWGDTIDLTPWIEELLARAAAYDPRDVPKWIRQRDVP